MSYAPILAAQGPRPLTPALSSLRLRPSRRALALLAAAALAVTFLAGRTSIPVPSRRDLPSLGLREAAAATRSWRDRVWPSSVDAYVHDATGRSQCTKWKVVDTPVSENLAIVETAFRFGYRDERLQGEDLHVSGTFHTQYLDPKWVMGHQFHGVDGDARTVCSQKELGVSQFAPAQWAEFTGASLNKHGYPSTSQKHSALVGTGGPTDLSHLGLAANDVMDNVILKCKGGYFGMVSYVVTYKGDLPQYRLWTNFTVTAGSKKYKFNTDAFKLDTCWNKNMVDKLQPQDTCSEEVVFMLEDDNTDIAGTVHLESVVKTWYQGGIVDGEVDADAPGSDNVVGVTRNSFYGPRSTKCSG